MRMLNPPHPGDLIWTEILVPTGLSVKAAAEALGVSRPALSNLLNGIGVKMDTLMRMQSSYDIARTRKRARTIKVRRYLHRAEATAR